MTVRRVPGHSGVKGDPGLQATREGRQTRCQKAAPDSAEEGSGPLSPATRRPCHDVNFPREKWGSTDSDVCWWCERGRQSREHLFKECIAWREEIRTLWKEAGEGSGSGGAGQSPTGSKKGFAYHARRTTAGPGNTTVRDLLSVEKYTGAVLKFLRATKVGEAKAGSLNRR